MLPLVEKHPIAYAAKLVSDHNISFLQTADVLMRILQTTNVHAARV